MVRSVAGTRDFCSSLAALVGPVQNIFFLTVHYFNFFVPIAQHAGQAAVLGGLSLYVCLWFVLPVSSHKSQKRLSRDALGLSWLGRLDLCTNRGRGSFLNF